MSFPNAKDFHALCKEALQTPFAGWDFSWIADRIQENPLDWDYQKIVEARKKSVQSLLDLGTGGGERLSQLRPLPPDTVATESYTPNVPVAKARLEPLGVRVIPLTEGKTPPFGANLPLADARFDLVINRHESYSPREIARVLRAGGRFITQQVGFGMGANTQRDFRGAAASLINWNLRSALAEIKDAGFTVETGREQFGTIRFFDIGALVYHLKAIPWLVENFDVTKDEKTLLDIHQIIAWQGYYEMISHYFLIIARKPGDRA